MINITVWVAIAGVFATIIVAMITGYLNRQNSLNLEDRKMKEQYYIKYISAISGNLNSIYSENNDAVIDENHAFNIIILLAGPKVVKALYDFQNLRINHLKYHNVKNYDEQYTKLFTDLVKKMRYDLYKVAGVNSGLNEFYLLAGKIKE
jgi:hypothetical protein